MLVKVTVSLEGVEDFESRIADIRRRARDPRMAFARMADAFRDWEADLFSAQPWQPDTERWIAYKAKHGKSLQTLRMTGALFRSFTVARGKYNVRRLDTRSLVVGTRDPVANIHQHARKLPRREPLRFTPDDERAWSGIMADFLFAPAERGGVGEGL